MLKRIAAIFLASIMAFAMCACDATSNLEQESDETENNETVESTVDEEETSVIDEDSYGIDEQVLYDRNGIVITATELRLVKNVSHTTFYYNVQNNNDFDVNVDRDICIVNGICVSPSSGVGGRCKAGEVTERWVTFNYDDFYDCSIEVMETLQLAFTISSDDDTVLDTTDYIDVKINGVNDYEQTYKKDGQVLYDEGGIRIVYIGSTPTYHNAYVDVSYVKRAYFYVENNTDGYISVNSFYDAINGTPIDGNQPGKGCRIAPGGFGYHISCMYRDKINDVELEYEEIETLSYGFEISTPDGEYILKNDASVYTVEIEH